MTYDRRIRLPLNGTLYQFREFVHFRRLLHDVNGPANVELDLSGVEFAHPSGMAPTVAVIDDLTERGWNFDVVHPLSDYAASYFHKAGWIAGITGEVSGLPQALPGSTFVPLTRYASVAELNPVITEALGHFTLNSVYPRGVLESIEWSLNEIADNVLIHAGGACGWLQLVEQPKKGLIEIVVVDCGQGICSSLRERYTDLVDDREAIQKAVEKGVTRNPAVGQGNGLAGTLRIAVAASGWVNIYSGEGLLRYLGGSGRMLQDRGIGRAPSRAASNVFVEQASPHDGTIVTLTLPTVRKLDVAEALWGYEPMSRFELDYMSDDGTEIRFEVAKEATGLGNRHSARPLRQRLHNLVNTFPDQRIVVDFEDVGLVSASFADEFIARLVHEVGVVTFFANVRLANMNNLVRRTMDAVLEQRLKT